jgi:hypothetical protein
MRSAISTPESHPLYRSEAKVKETTEWLLSENHEVFQLWMLDPDEGAHSLKVLEALQLPHSHPAQILSLGCGVGGMEAHWKKARPDFQFDLLNQSKAQLDLCVCEGFLIHSKAEDYEPMSAPDVTLISYALGHMDIPKVLDRALEYTSGPVVVLDVFDTNGQFCEIMDYNAPSTAQLAGRGFHRVKTPPWSVHPFIKLEHGIAEIVQRNSTPYLWISE